MFCDFCGSKLDPNEKFCHSCGHPVTESTARVRKFCPKCGKEARPDAAMCEHCGAVISREKLDEATGRGFRGSSAGYGSPSGNAEYRRIKDNFTAVDPNASDKYRIVDLILVITLGFVGAHKYYEGKFGIGLLYTFTFGLFFIGALIDFVKILSGEATDRQGRKIKNWGF